MSTPIQVILNNKLSREEIFTQPSLSQELEVLKNLSKTLIRPTTYAIQACVKEFGII